MPTINEIVDMEMHNIPKPRPPGAKSISSMIEYPAIVKPMPKIMNHPPKNYPNNTDPQIIKSAKT